ncbi:MAG TPA: hypothetical protein VFS37_06585 [Conexibacter sp.]|nr:hypothetical protein [Conexibacter sp.]
MRVARAHVTVVLVICAAALLAWAAPAGALSVTSVDVVARSNGGDFPPSGPYAAGAHPDLFTRFTFSDSGTYSADTARDLQVHFAPGIVAYVNHVGRCTAAQFAADSGAPSTCPASSLVGTAVTGLTTDNGLVNTLLGGQVSGTIYNIDPPPGSPAALGIDIAPTANPHIKVVATISVDPHDLGLTASLSLPNTAQLAPLGLPLATVNVHTDWIEQTLFGYVSGRSFFTNPTACIPAAISVSASSYSGANGSGSGSYTPTDCAGVPFSTRLAISVDPPISDWTSTVTTNVQPGAADIPRANSHVRSTTVTLPQSLLLNPALAARLDACTDAQFQLRDTSVEARCPPSSAVGDIDFVSPILGSFPGRAYFGSQTPTDRLRLFLDVPLYGAHIKVSAHVHPSTTTGQITTVFDELPQIAFTDFTLTFHGGPRSALVSPTQCGAHTASAVTTPWSGTTPQLSSGSFSVSWDGRGAPCQRLFGPSMTTATSNDRAGASPDFTLTATRPDRHVPVGRMAFDLPPGLVGNLALRGLVQCALRAAAQASCPASSRLGPVVSVDGSGTEPPALPGDVYLTKPKQPGDPAGLSVAVPAQLGPVDAGIVIVGARLQLRPDGGLHVTSDPIPSLVEGIPLAIRRLTVNVTRNGFMRNPTSCGEKTAFGHFDSLGSEHAEISSKLSFKDCDRLGFNPNIKAFIGAKHRTRVGAHPPFTTVVTARGDDATIRSAHVRLPRGVASNTRSLNAACAADAFAAGRCPEVSRVANAVAHSPLLRDPVTGPVFLVKQPRGLPRLVVQFRSPIAFQLEGKVNIGKRGGIGTTFPVVPDLPITRFTLRFHGGAYGALALTRNICRRALRLPASFSGHNGRTVKLRPRIAVRGCRGARNAQRHRHRTHRRR